MRRIFSMLLVFCMLFMAVPCVFAEESAEEPYIIDKSQITTIQAEGAYSAHSSLSLKNSYVSVNMDQWLDYKVNVKEEGEYIIRAITATTSTEFDMSVSIDGVESLVGKIKPTSSYSDYQPMKLGILYLPSGEHTLRFKIGMGGMHFDYITFEEYVYISEEDAPMSYEAKTGPYKNIYLPASVEAEDFDRGLLGAKSLDGINDGEKYRPDDKIDIYGSDKLGYYLSLFEGETVSYTVNTESDGVFALNVTKGAGSLNIYFDDKPTPFVLLTNGSSQNLKEYFVANILLEKGTHKITFESFEPDTRLDKFSLLKATGVYYTLEDLEKELPDLTPPEKEEIHSVYKNLYVAENGSDSADGTKENPFATIGRAKEEVARINDEMTGDIVVNIAPGKYQLKETEIFTKEHSGKNGYDVIFRGEDMFAPPIVHGGKKVDGWQKHNDYIWKAPLETDEVRNLYINGYPSVRARSKYRYVVTGNYNAPGSENVRDGVTISKKNFPSGFSKPSEMEFVVNTFWVNHRFPIKDIIYREEDVAIHMDNTEYFGNYDISSSLIGVTPGRAIYLENAMEFLDEPGEFYYNKEEKTIYYYPYAKEDIESADCYIAEVEFLINASGENPDEKICNITFDNIDFRYGAYDGFSETGYWTHQADNMRQVTNGKRPLEMMPAQIEINYADNVNILNSSISCMGSAGIGLYHGVTNSEITGNIIRDISATSIIVGHFNHTDAVDDSERCQYVDITNNVIHRVANEYLQCAAFAIYYEKFINVCHNDFLDCPYSATTIGWGWVTVSPAGNINYCHNRIENPMVNLDDGGAIYTLGPLRQTHIAYNYIVNNQGDYGGALYTDSGSAFLKLHHNVIGQTSNLWSQGQYYTQYMEMYETYSNTDNYSNRENSTGSIYRDIHVVEDGAWPKEALEIMDNAGLTPQYKNLLNRAKYPEWRKIPIYTVPEGKFVSSQGTEFIQAEDFLEGGEGVGYHKITELPNNNSYRSDGVALMAHPSETGYIIHTNFPSEWMAYEVETEKDGVYSFELKASHAWPKNQPQPAVNVYIDGEMKIENAYTAVSEDWNNIKSKVLGEVELTKGTHNVRIEILNNGFYIDAFRLVPQGEEYVYDERGNDIDYDEGKLVLEEESVNKVETENSVSVSFTDTLTHWANNEIIRAAKKGIVNGFPDGSFRPDEKVTLRQTILMAYRALKIETKSSALDDAKNRGIFNEDYDLEKALTREEFAETVMKIYSVKYSQFTYVYEDGLFSDYESIENSRKIYVLGAIGIGIMKGDENGAFRPHDSITRAEAAAALSRM